MHIRFENLFFRYKSFGSPSGDILRHVNLEIQAGEFLAIAGPSGAGKTTLMQHFTGLLKPTAGRVLIDGRDLWAPGTKLTDLRRRIGLVFQFPEAQLFEETVYQDVAFGLRNLELAEEEVGGRVRLAMQQVGLDFEAFRHRSPIHLSEGEKRRAALAGVLVMNPETLVLDEPTAGLDYLGVQSFIKILRDYHSAGKTVVFISHQLDLIFSLVNRIVLMNSGEIRFDGQIRRLVTQPEILESAGLSQPRILQLIQHLKKSGLADSLASGSVTELFQAISLSPKSVLK